MWDEKKRNIINKEKVFSHYGKKCSICEIDDIDMLQVDHIGDNGNIHRKKIGIGSTSLYRWIIRNNFPSDFRILCANHNWKAKTNLEKKEWDSKSHSSISIRTTKYHKKQKEIILNHYGQKCMWPEGCDITDPDMLHIHHKNGKGIIERKKLGGNYASYRSIIKNNRYDEFTILCPNHHNKIHKMENE